MTDVEKLKQELIEFGKTQSRFSEYGAWDTEPDVVYQTAVWKTYAGIPFTVPKTGEDWQLFTCSMKCGNAARALTAQLKKVMMAIGRCKFQEQKQVLELLKYYCDRFMPGEWEDVS
jgi:hypothetical protein